MIWHLKQNVSFHSTICSRLNYHITCVGGMCSSVISHSAIICTLLTEMLLQNIYFVIQVTLSHYPAASTLLYIQLRPCLLMIVNIGERICENFIFHICFLNLDISFTSGSILSQLKPRGVSKWGGSWGSGLQDPNFMRK